MKKTLYIHIGTEKTGTTILQSTFHKNRELLKGYSINYPAIGFYHQAQFSLVAALIKEQTGKAFEVSPDNYSESKEESWGSLVKIINESKCVKHIISVEHFSSRLNEKSISWIKYFLDSNLKGEVSVKIITYVRRQDQYLESSFSTAVKAGDKRTFQEYKVSEECNSQRYDHYEMLSPWIKLFGLDNIFVKVFDRVKMEGGDIVKDFFRIIECDHVKLERSVFSNDKNESWHPKTIRLAIFVNRNSRLRDKLGRNRLNFLNKLDDVFKAKYPGFGKKYMTLTEAVEFNRKYEDSNGRLSSMFFGGNEVFSDVYLDDTHLICFDSIELYDSLDVLISFLN